MEPDNKVYWQTRYQKIHYYVEIGQAEACLKSQTEQLKKHPDNYMEWTVIIYAHYYAGNYEEAYKYFSKAKTKFPEKWELYEIGSSVCKTLKKYEEAIQCCDKSYELNTESLDAKYAKAFCYEEMGNYKQAYQTWLEIIQSLKKNGYDVEMQREEKRAQECLEKMTR